MLPLRVVATEVLTRHGMSPPLRVYARYAIALLMADDMKGARARRHDVISPLLRLMSTKKYRRVAIRLHV